MVTRRIPEGVDVETSRRLRQTFLLVRTVRGVVLLVFLAVAAVAVEARGWPSVVTAGLVVAMVVQVVLLVAWWRQYRDLGR